MDYRKYPSIALAAGIITLIVIVVSACGGSGPVGGAVATGGPNKDKATWGHYRGPAAQWYLSDSQVIWRDKTWVYDIQSVQNGRIVAYFNASESQKTYIPPTAQKTISLTSSGDTTFQCSPTTASSGTITDKAFAIAKIVGAEAEASGTAMQGSFARSLGKALVAAGGVSLVIQNVLNNSDLHTVAKTDDTGKFDATGLIPGDSYKIVIGGSGVPSVVTIGENKSDLGIVVKPT